MLRFLYRFKNRFYKKEIISTGSSMEWSNGVSMEWSDSTSMEWA